MPIIQSIDEFVKARRHECVETIGDQYRPSIRPIYASLNGLRPELIGSCILLSVDNIKFVVTAAHVMDWLDSHFLYVAGSIGTKPVQILGEIKITDRIHGDRDADKFDCAFWRISESEEKQLGDVKFIDESCFSHDKVDSTYHVYLVMGYPISQNKGKADNSTRSIKPVMLRYIASVVTIPQLVEKLKISGEGHFFVKHEKYSKDLKGNKVSSVSLKGISGGALFDLGNFSLAETLDPNSKCVGQLSGMVIERKKKDNALVVVKIGLIIEAIRKYGMG